MQPLARSVLSVLCLGFLPSAFVLAQGRVDPPGKDAGDVYGAWSPTPEHRDARHGG